MKKKSIVKSLVSVSLVAAMCVPNVISNNAEIPVLSNISSILEFNADAVSYTYTYYPKCRSNYSSLVDALRSVGVSDTSYANRKKIAALNGYSSYSGTASQNTALLNKLKNGKLIKSSTVNSTTNSNTSSSSSNYYPKCKSSYTSFVDALRSVGVSDTSYTNRKKIAALNGYTSYSGTASQNTALLNKLKNGKLIKSSTANSTTSSNTNTSSSSSNYYPKCKSSYTSFVDALRSVGVSDTSYANRKKIAALNGYTSYSGTASQNTALLNKLKNGKLIKSTSSGSSTNSNNNSSSSNKTGSPAVSGNSYNSNGNVSVTNRAKENNPYYKNTGWRSSAAYNQVINQFNVQSNSRYKRTSTATYCNIFAWDVMSAMNVQLPHWVKNNVPSTYGKGNELNANATYNWLKNYGSRYGWSSVSASTAQSRANKGYPTIAIWYNTSGKSGHVAVIRPEGNGYSYSSAKGPVIAQAGGSNFNYGNISTGFGKGIMNKVMYYTHS